VLDGLVVVHNLYGVPLSHQLHKPQCCTLRYGQTNSVYGRSGVRPYVAELGRPIFVFSLSPPKRQEFGSYNSIVRRTECS
jgi:hypothetical protein